MPLLLSLISAALKQLLIGIVTERLLKDLIIVGLEKLSKRTNNHVDDEICELIKRSLYPDFEAGQPPTLDELTEKQYNAEK